MRLLSRPALHLAAAASLAGCASSAQHPYVAPTSQTIVSTTEERQTEPPAHLIYVENHSTVPVTVFSVTLSGCENVKQPCSPRPTNLRIAPGRRELATRVEPRDAQQGFGYHFGFSWHADSAGIQALNALAASGDAQSQARLNAMNRTDSLARAGSLPRYHELSPADFAAIAPRARLLRIAPDSLLLAPGQRATVEQVRILIADSAGIVLGQTRWFRYQVPVGRSARLEPPTTIIAQSPGRAVFHFSLADEAQALLPQVPAGEIDLPVVVAFPEDPHAPTFEGIAVDADSKAPLGCVRVALEDSLQNVIASSRTDRAGTFLLRAPRPGSYRVRFETFGWAPVGGPLQAAGPDEAKQQQYSVSFVDRLLRAPMVNDFSGVEHPYPVAVTASAFAKAPPAGTVLGKSTKPLATGPRAIVQSVSLRGTDATPILDIVGNAPAGTTWIEFVVGAEGGVDASSIIYPAGSDERAKGSVSLVLPHVKFSPAKEEGRPTCELMRMQVTFTPR